MRVTEEMWIAIIGLLPSLIAGAQAVFGKGTGATKKRVVTQMAHAAYEALENVSTGGQKTTLEKFAPRVSPVIDSIVATMFHDTGAASTDIDKQQPAG